MLLEAMGGEYEVCRIPGMVATASGALVAYYECRRGSSSDWAQIDIKIIRSEDGGKSFYTVGLIEGEGDTLNNPVMIADGDILHLLYCRNYYNLYYSKSEYGGKSFGEPREITDCLYEVGREFTVAAVGPGHGIIKEGRIIVPVWFAYNAEKPKSHHPSFISTLYSDDGGESFHVGEVIGDGILNDPSECALALTADGRVLISIRNENPEHRRALAYSENGADGWTLPTLCENLEDPVCQGSMLHEGGRIYHINCASAEDRLSLCVKISSDGFESLERVEVDEIGGYSDIALLDGDICVIYEKLSRKAKEGLFFKRMGKNMLEDILKGKKVSVFGASMCTYDGYSNNIAHNSTIGANKPYYGTAESENVKCRDMSVGETFWGRLIDKYGMSLCVNNSWSGSKVLDDNLDAAGYNTRPTELHRDDGTLPDIILSFMGNNDFSKERPAGEISDELFSRIEAEVDAESGYIPMTFAEGYAMMLCKVTRRYPDAKVFLFNMAWRTAEKSELLLKYNEIIEKVAARYSAYVVRLTESKMSGLNYARYTCDGKLHPNSEGMLVWSELIEDAFRLCFAD